MKYKNFLEKCKKIESTFDLPFYIYSKTCSEDNEKVIAPLKIGLKITNECHFRCPYCFVTKNTEYLKFQDLKTILCKLPQYPYEVYLTGGEATLHPDFNKIVDYIDCLGILIKLHTTGVVPFSSEKYILNNIKKFSSIQISLDSIKNFSKLRPNLIDKDPLHQICDFCKKLQQKRFENIIVNIVVSSLNVMELSEIFDFCLDNNLKYIQLSSIFTTSKRLLLNDLDYMDYYDGLLATYQRKGIIFRTAPFCHPWSLALQNNYDYRSPLYCPAQKTEFEIDMHGNVYPCPFLHDEKHRMGNLINDDFSDVWYSGVEELNHTNWSKNSKCKSCSLYKYCGGGCYALASLSGKDYDMRCSLHAFK